MAPASSERKGHKRRKARAAPAKIHQAPKRKGRIAKNTPLNVQRDATRKQEVQRTRRENSEQTRYNNTVPLFLGRELIELMNRRARALVELPMRMTHCHSPFALWSEQTRFMQGMFSDCHSVAQRMMTNALYPPPPTRSSRGQQERS